MNIGIASKGLHLHYLFLHARRLYPVFYERSHRITGEIHSRFSQSNRKWQHPVRGISCLGGVRWWGLGTPSESWSGGGAGREVPVLVQARGWSGAGWGWGRGIPLLDLAGGRALMGQGEGYPVLILARSQGRGRAEGTLSLSWPRQQGRYTCPSTGSGGMGYPVLFLTKLPPLHPRG